VAEHVGAEIHQRTDIEGRLGLRLDREGQMDRAVTGTKGDETRVANQCVSEAGSLTAQPVTQTSRERVEISRVR